LLLLPTTTDRRVVTRVTLELSFAAFIIYSLLLSSVTAQVTSCVQYVGSANAVSPQYNCRTSTSDGTQPQYCFKQVWSAPAFGLSYVFKGCSYQCTPQTGIVATTVCCNSNNCNHATPSTMVNTQHPASRVATLLAAMALPALYLI